MIDVKCDLCGRRTHTMSVINGTGYNNGWLVDLHKHKDAGVLFKDAGVNVACSACARPLREAVSVSWKVRRKIKDKHYADADVKIQAELSELLRSAVTPIIERLKYVPQKGGKK